MRVVAIDPGGTTGLVVANLDKVKNHLTVAPWQEKLTALGLYDRLCEYAPGLVLCEDFEFRPNSPHGLVLTSAHLIGAVQLHCERFDVGLRMQKAAYAKSGFYRGSRNLKVKGVYLGGEDYEHSMDAMRHFMQWFYFGPGFRFNRNPTVELVK